MNSQFFYLISAFVCFTLAVPYKEATPKKHNRIKQKLIPKLNHSRCSFTDICDDATAYPTKIIKKLMKRKKNMPLFSKTSLIEPSDDSLIATNRNSVLELDNLCRTKTVTTTPKQGYDSLSGERRFIVNVDDSIQTVVYETCAEPKAECIDQKLMPFRYGTQCTQKYNVVRLVSLSKQGKLEYGKFKVPSTCVCSQYRS